MKSVRFTTALMMVLFVLTVYSCKAQKYPAEPQQEYPEEPQSEEPHIEVESETHTIIHEKDHTTYTVVLLWDMVPLSIAYPGQKPFYPDERYYRNPRIQLFDTGNNPVQSFSLELGGETDPVYEIYFRDVNTDGYTDIVIVTPGIRNEPKYLYIWDVHSRGFIKVIYKGGFQWLSDIYIHEGYIENNVYSSGPEPGMIEGREEYLVWRGNTLVVAKESDIFGNATEDQTYSEETDETSQ